MSNFILLENYFYKYDNNQNFSGNVSSIVGSSYYQGSSYVDYYRAARIKFKVDGNGASTLKFTFLAQKTTSIGIPSEVGWPDQDGDLTAYISVVPNNDLLFGESVTEQKILIKTSVGTYHNIASNTTHNGVAILTGTINYDLLPNTEYYLYIVPTNNTIFALAAINNSEAYPGVFELSGTPATKLVYIKVEGAWKQGIMYKKVDDAWKQGTPYVKTDNSWN